MTPPEIESARLQLGMNQLEFARAVGLAGKNADRTVRRWEAGKVTPSGPVRQNIKRLLRGMSENRCEAKIYNPVSRAFTRCHNPTKVEVSGKRYCGIHDPAKIAARRARMFAIDAAHAAIDDQRRKLSQLKVTVVVAALAHPEFADLRERMKQAEAALADAQAKLKDLS